MLKIQLYSNYYTTPRHFGVGVIVGPTPNVPLDCAIIKMEFYMNQGPHLNDEYDCHVKLKPLMMHIKQAKK
jgi:hypothetical protein